MQNKTIRATLIGSISIFLWGTLALLTRLTEGRIPPFQLMAMTFTLAFLLMSVNWWRQGHSGLRHLRQPVLAWILGVGGYFGYHFCYFLAMTKAPAVSVSLLAYLWPLLIVLLAGLLPGENLLKRHMVGAVIALFGCWLLIGQGADGFNPQYLSGYLLALTCALIWSGYSVLSRLVKQVSTDAAGWFCAATALLALLCHWLWETTVWPDSMAQWIGVIGLGIGPVGIAFFTWDYGIKHGNLQLLGVLAYSAPLISALLLVLAGLAPADITLVLSCLAIVIGSLIAGYRRARR
ncbi:DMT family transporter [Amphritea sp. 2_MG-2023]|uniref:aromatic amino acid exporter YddG n=1 Tax=Amphritea TaxID=515417 RepID=UPI001C06C496|nr:MULTISPECIES: DMT family transporter [Amphritea]MBU2965644.1 DMT family transporter [Amphritea atlantica]MDO6417200.1 DMT family transporter [Amphritea sp. 2_MG-2023]